MKAKRFLIAWCLFYAGVLLAQSNPFIQKWEQQALSRSASWNSYTRDATAPNRPTYTSLFVNGKFVASFNNNSACQSKIKELVEIAKNMYGKSPTSKPSRDNSKIQEGIRRFGGSVDSDALRNQLTKARDEAVAKGRQETLSQIKGYCKCRTEKNPNYDPNSNANDFGNNNLFVTGTQDDADDTPQNPLFDNSQTQYDNLFDMPSARDPQTPSAGATPGVKLNFENVGAYTGKGIYVDNENWTSKLWQVTPIERRASDYTISLFDAIKKEITIDLKFRDEVVAPIQEFMENKTSSIPQLMRNLYRERTGYDIEDLRNKQNLTKEERKIIDDYNHFVKQMAVELDYQANEAKKNPDPEKKLIDFAIMANDVYAGPDSRLVQDTDWRPIVSSQGVNDMAIAQAIDAINRFNTNNNNNSGSYAQIYKNELTGEYTLAFRGSELTVVDWKNNIQQGFSAFSEQYAFAASIGECLSRSNVKVNIVGHSLGGGLATVAGLKTGFPTYTYNQADISQGTVDKYKLDVSKSDNITAYYMESEILTKLQNETREYNTLIPLGKKVKTGSVITEKSEVLSVVSKTAGVAEIAYKPAKVIGAAATVLDKGDNLRAMIDGHRMPHTEQYFRSIYGESQAKWEKYNNVQLVLRNDNTYSYLYIDTK